jgi:anthranilate phosphoribosyltransferase
MVEKIARVTALLGTTRSMVVHGQDGVDEISISAPTTAFVVENGSVESLEITPERFGLERSDRGAVTGGTVEDNLRLAGSVLAGEHSPARDVVLLNAGAGLFVAGLADDPQRGVELARELIDSGRAREQLERVRQVSVDLKRERAGAAP